MTRANRPRYAARLNAFKQLSPGSDVKEAFVVEPETLNWMDGLVAVGISL